MGLTESEVLGHLSSVRHPEQQRGIVELGLVGGVECSDGRILLRLRSLRANDPFGGSLCRAVRRVLESAYPGLSVDVEHESDRVVSSECEADFSGAGGVGRVRHIVAIASGKGGVGKSTLTSNLSVSLSRLGYRVGLLDADVFGPSAPIMLGVEGEHAAASREGDSHLIYPVEAYGVRLLSMGFFVSAEDALVWRGPMASNALKQLISMGVWGELDVLLIDLPPGTSDIHLTVTQELRLSGALVVTTPQRVALADASKGISMFQNRQLQIPILGVVENMSWFEPAELPGRRYYLFGRDGARALCASHGVPLLGQIPLDESICEGGDGGCPIATGDSVVGQAFLALARQLASQLDL